MGFIKRRSREEDFPQPLERDYRESEDEDFENHSEPIFSQGRPKVVNMADNSMRGYEQQTESINMVIFKPVEYEQAQTIIDYLKLQKPIIVNLDEIELSIAQRILDFITGAVYALAGDIKKAARNIFVVVPSNVEISNANDQTADAGTVEDTSYTPDDFDTDNDYR